jgi:hypothetical protein
MAGGKGLGENIENVQPKKEKKKLPVPRTRSIQTCRLCTLAYHLNTIVGIQHTCVGPSLGLVVVGPMGERKKGEISKASARKSIAQSAEGNSIDSTRTLLPGADFP